MVFARERAQIRIIRNEPSDWQKMPDDLTSIVTDTAERPLKRALLRGWRRKCPNCGSGPLLKDFLKVRDHCSVCGEELHHHRADDGPAYLTILATGHLLVPLIHVVYVRFEPQPIVMATGFSIAAVIVALYLLPRFKGGMVAFQWAKRMHGFAAR